MVCPYTFWTNLVYRTVHTSHNTCRHSFTLCSTAWLLLTRCSRKLKLPEQLFEPLHRISRDFDRGVVADTRSKQTDWWTWSPHKDFFSFFHKESPKPIPVRNVSVSISSNLRYFRGLPAYPQSSRFILLITLSSIYHLSPSCADCPVSWSDCWLPWMNTPASNATSSWRICKNRRFMGCDIVTTLQWYLG